MIAAPDLLHALTVAGVDVHRAGRRLVLEPADRIPDALRPALADRATLRALAGLVPAVLDVAEEAAALRLGDALAARFRAAAAVRRRCGSGLPGAAARDARYFARLDARAEAAAELYAERAGIREHDGGLPRDEAERLAAEDVAALLPFARGTP